MKRRNSNRLEGYDYSLPGAYFVTLVNASRVSLFGELVNEQPELNDMGKMIQKELIRSTGMRKEVRLDEFIIMPDHLHFIVFFDEFGQAEPNGLHQTVGAYERAPTSQAALGSFVAVFKAATEARLMNSVRRAEGFS